MRHEPKFRGRTASFWVAQLGDGDESFQEQAWEVLEARFGEAAVPHIVEALDSDSALTRRKAAALLGKLGGASVPALRATLLDPACTSRHRDWARQALEWIGSPEAKAVLALPR
jgi:HEAT repeat protein